MKIFTDRLCFLRHALSWLFCCVLLVPSLAQAAGACSPEIGNVALNEYNYIDNFTEVKQIGSSFVNMTGWKVTVYTANRTAVASLPSSGVASCLGGAYQTSQFASNEISQNADIVLTDANNDIVDIVRVRTSLPVTTTYYTPAIPSCSFVSPPYDLLVSSSNKGVDRLPDGAGAWRNTPGTGSGSFQSRCGPNIAGGSADLAVTKVANVSSVAMGDAVTFTVTVTNNGTGSATAVQLDDPIPNGSSYFSHSVSTGTYAYNTGVWSIGTLAAGGSATLSVTVVTTLVGTVTNTATVSSETYDPVSSNNSRSVAVTVTSPPSAKLEAVELGTAASATPRIFTKLAGQSFSLDLLALNTSGATPTINTGYSRTVTIELVDGSSSATCSARTSLQNAGSYTFTGSGTGKDNGRKTYAFVYPNAARNVYVRMTDNASPPLVSCSTDNFAIRPHALAIANTAATNADATGASTTATPAIKAGANFTLQATAVVLPAGTVLTGYTGTPLVEATKINAHAGAVVAGVVSGTFGTAVAGVASGNAFKYSEVGYFQLQSYGVTDANFTTVDQPSGCRTTHTCDCVSTTTPVPVSGVPPNFSTTLSGSKYGCDIGNSAATGYIGRFYPDSFKLSSPVFENRKDIASCHIQTSGTIAASSSTLTVTSVAGFAIGDAIIVRGAGTGGVDLLTTVAAIGGSTLTLANAASSAVTGATVYRQGFSYQDEPMRLGFTIEARNGLASSSITRNYKGAWAGGTIAFQAENNNNGTNLGARVIANTTPAWADGVYTLNATNAQFVRLAAPDGPYDNLQIGVAVNDPDGAVLQGRNMNPATATDCTALGNCTGVAVANTRQLFGRLKLSNAHGSELLSLPVPAEVQYWNGAVFVTNTADNCTTLTAANIYLAKSPVACTSSLSAIPAFAAGRSSLTLSRPNATCRVDLSVDLSAAAENKLYLQGRWSGTSFDQNPTARATFGIYKRGPLIYMREMY